MIFAANYAFLCQLLRERSGQVLFGDKQYLVESRLVPVARRHGHRNIDDLCRAARNPGAEAIRVDITEAMTTNETFFLRDKQPFEQLAGHMLPYLLKARANRRRLRIWCAAASTGQEPYSIAMLVKDIADKMPGWRTEILATDISNEVLQKAKAGAYTQFEVQRGLPIAYLVKYFKQVGDMWQLDAGVRSMVRFRQLNLLRDFATLGPFDVVFCRNVLIYFDQATKTSVLDRIADIMEPDGFLVLGASETTIGLTDKLKMIEGMRSLHAPLCGPGRVHGASRPASLKARRA
jgi:chemotaxis protein methyltransferase CheR